MKYKAISLLTICLIFLITFTGTYLIKKDTEDKNIEKETFRKDTCNIDEFCTHLPVVMINTNEEIPGVPIYENENKEHVLYYTTTSDGLDRVRGNISIIDNDEKMNYLTDSPSFQSELNIKIRGNSSRSFNKKSYSFELINDDETKNEQKVLNMDKHDEWVLHGPYLDKTLVRNHMMYNLADEMMDYAPNTRYAEVFINGKYQGVYLVMESITAGKENSRLPLTVNKKNQIFSGYLLRLDRGNKMNTISNIDTFTKYTHKTDYQLNIEYPGSSNLTPQMIKDINDDFSSFEKRMYSYDFNHPDEGYANFIDIDSFVNYFILNEFASNSDAGRYSTYIYKDLEGKYHMSVWDFNNAFDNYQANKISHEGFHMTNVLWFDMLLRDENFCERVIERYKELRKTILDEEYLNDYIDDTIAYLGKAIDRNNEQWHQSFKQNLLHPYDRNLKSYEEAVKQLNNYIHLRITWLDENIESLRQYSAESKIKKYTLTLN